MRRTNREKHPEKFWKEIGRMMGRKKKEWVETFKNEQGGIEN